MLYYSINMSLCIFFSEVFESNLEASYPFTHKFLSLYFQRTSTIAVITAVMKWSKKENLTWIQYYLFHSLYSNFIYLSYIVSFLYLFSGWRSKPKSSIEISCPVSLVYFSVLYLGQFLTFLCLSWPWEFWKHG